MRSGIWVPDLKESLSMTMTIGEGEQKGTELRITGDEKVKHYLCSLYPALCPFYHWDSPQKQRRLDKNCWLEMFPKVWVIVKWRVSSTGIYNIWSFWTLISQLFQYVKFRKTACPGIGSRDGGALDSELTLCNFYIWLPLKCTGVTLALN